MLNFFKLISNTLSKSFGVCLILLITACGGGGGGEGADQNSNPQIQQSPNNSSSLLTQINDGRCEGSDRNNDGLVDACNKSGSIAMNISEIAYWTTGYPFIDLMKQSGRWEDNDFTTQNENFNVDHNDWILSLDAGETAGVIFLEVEDVTILPFSRLIVFYEGEGTIEYQWSASKVENESLPGRDVVTISNGSHLLNITNVNATDPLRNIRIIPENLLAEFEDGEIFNPAFIERIGQFRSLRFMDWMRTNNSTQAGWSNRPQVENREWVSKGLPLEAMIFLANQVQADPWFSIPHMADDNYVNEFARIVADNLDSNLNVFIEHSNEVWNFIFEQTDYASNSAEARWGAYPDGYMQWHGMRTAQICETFKSDYFSTRSDVVKCVLGVHTGWQGLQEAAVQCPLYVAEGNQPCYQYGFDYIAVTTYFSAGLNGSMDDPAHTAEIRSWFSDSDGGLDRAFNQLYFGTELRGFSEYTSYTGVIDELTAQMSYWSNYANSLGLGLIAYEGGSHVTANGYPHQDEQAFIDFHLAVNNDARMQQLYNELLNTWRDSGGELHAFFNDVGPHSKFGSWGALTHLYQDTSSKWQAITEFNNDVDCWWPCD